MKKLRFKRIEFIVLKVIVTTFFKNDVSCLAPIAEEIALSKFTTMTKLLERRAGTWITRKPKPFASNNELETIYLEGFSLILS